MAMFKEITYRYEYERAVREGYLVDYDSVAVKSHVRMHGIFLKEGEQVDIVNPVSGAQQLDLLEDEREFPSTEIEEKITSPDSNRKILEEIKMDGRARTAIWTVSKDAYFRGQRRSTHFPCGSAC